MSLVTSLFRSRFSSRKGASVERRKPAAGGRGARKRDGLGLEPLEDRTLLSVAPVHWSDFSYVGEFRMPDVSGQASTFGYSAETVMAYNPYGDGGKGSLFVRGHTYQQMVAEVNIPTPSKTGLPSATVLQPFADVAPGYMFSTDQGVQMDRLSGLVVTTVPGQTSPSLFWTVRHYYNVGTDDNNSHGVSTLNLSNPQPRGLWNIAGYSNNATAGYLGEIPAAFADQYLGGKQILTGQQGVAGQGSSSWGPAAFAIKPWLDSGGFPANGTQLPAVPLVYYPSDHPYPNWNLASKVSSVQWIQMGDKQALAFTVTLGLGKEWYGAGPDYPYLAGGDKVITGKGYHAPPYETQIWLYSVDDVLKVIQGQMQPWDIRPYEQIDFQSYLDQQQYYPGPMAFDAQHQRLFMMDTSGVMSGYDPVPVIYVFQGSGAGGGVVTAGVQITQTGGSTAVTEGGATDSYTVVLASQPTANVTITLGAGSQLTTSVSTLTFTSSNWNVAQTVTVTAVNDTVVEGNHTGTITHTVTSTDSNYNGLSVAPLSVSITDNDVAPAGRGAITQTGGSTAVTEGGATDSYTVVLATQPTANVTISVRPDSQVSDNPITLTFTPSNWNVAQTVTVAAIDDTLVEGTHTGTINYTVSSTDSRYNGMSVGRLRWRSRTTTRRRPGRP